MDRKTEDEVVRLFEASSSYKKVYEYLNSIGETPPRKEFYTTSAVRVLLNRIRVRDDVQPISEHYVLETEDIIMGHYALDKKPQDIARILNKHGCRTKKGGKWQALAILDIIENKVIGDELIKKRGENG